MHMSLGLTEDDFLIYIADTMDQAVNLVPYDVKMQFALAPGGRLVDNQGRIRGVVSDWFQVAAEGLGGVHRRVHVWATGSPTRFEKDQVSNVTSHWLSHVEWV